MNHVGWETGMEQIGRSVLTVPPFFSPRRKVFTCTRYAQWATVSDHLTDQRFFSTWCRGVALTALNKGLGRSVLRLSFYQPNRWKERERGRDKRDTVLNVILGSISSIHHHGARESMNSKLSGDAFINARYMLGGGIIVWLAECHSDSERSTKFVIAMPLCLYLSFSLSHTLSLSPSPLSVDRRED